MNDRNRNDLIKLTIILAVIGLFALGGYAFYQTNSLDTIDTNTVSETGDELDTTASPEGISLIEGEDLDEEISEEPDTGVTADAILDNPEAFIGRRVTLRAEVEELVSSRAFTLDAAGFIDDSLLVITQSPTNVYEDPDWFNDDIWEVVGTVAVYDAENENMASDLSLDLNTGGLDTYQGKPVIIAESVEMYSNGDTQ